MSEKKKEPPKLRRTLFVKAVGFKSGRRKEWTAPRMEVALQTIKAKSPTLAERHHPQASSIEKGTHCYFINRFDDNGPLGMIFEVCHYIHGHIPEHMTPDLAKSEAEIKAVELKDADGSSSELVHRLLCVAYGQSIIMEVATGQGGGAAAVQTLLTQMFRRHLGDPSHPSLDLADIGSSDLKKLIHDRGGVVRVSAKLTTGIPDALSVFGKQLSDVRATVPGADKCGVTWEADKGTLDTDLAIEALEEAEDDTLSSVVLHLKHGGTVADLNKYREKRAVYVQQLPDGRAAVSEIESELLDYLKDMRDPKQGGPLTTDGMLKQVKILSSKP